MSADRRWRSSLRMVRRRSMPSVGTDGVGCQLVEGQERDVELADAPECPRQAGDRLCELPPLGAAGHERQGGSDTSRGDASLMDRGDIAALGRRQSAGQHRKTLPDQKLRRMGISSWTTRWTRLLYVLFSPKLKHAHRGHRHRNQFRPHDRGSRPTRSLVRGHRPRKSDGAPRRRRTRRQRRSRPRR